MELTEERLCQEIVERVPDAIVFADLAGTIRLWNAGAEAVFGFSKQEALGKPLEIIIPEGLRERHSEGYRRVMETGKSRYSKELLAVPALRKDGSRISIEFSIAVVSSGAGAILGTAAVIRDVTARWERDRALKQKLAALEGKGEPLP
jgi:PAS domain S-box-containing protein